MHGHLTHAAALLGMVLLVGAAPPQPRPPVMVGGEAELDACTTTYAVSGLNPRGDNFLSLRSAPAATARELARLRPGQVVWGCDASRDGAWKGVLVAPSRDNVDCGVGTPIAERRAYHGPCTSGWVARRFLTPLAG